MTTDVVGPLPTIRFRDGTKTAYEPPKNTLDPRYDACSDHHPACDCREAERAEDVQEHRAAIDDASRVIGHLIDSPCPAERRQNCALCMAALTTWPHRYETAFASRRRVPF